MGTSYQPTPQGGASVGGAVRQPPQQQAKGTPLYGMNRDAMSQFLSQQRQAGVGYDPNQRVSATSVAPQYPQFSAMQQQGMARPGPQQYAYPPTQQVGQYAPSQQQQQFTGQLQGAVSQALQTPSRYDLGQVQQVRDALTAQLQQQFGASQKKLDEDLARRGLSASSIGAGYMGDLAGQQATALSGLNAQLIQDAAQNNAQDLAAALGAGQSFQQAMANQGLAGYGANLQGAQANNQANLARAQFGQGQYEFGQQFGQHQLENLQQYGLQGRAQNLAELQNTQQNELSQRQQALDEQVKTGQLTIEQRDQALRELQNQQASQLAQAQFGEGQRQFNTTFGEGARQFDLQQQLQQQLGLGNLNVQQQQAATQAAAQKAEEAYQNGQMTLAQKDQVLRELTNQQQYGLQLTGQQNQQSQFLQNLQQQMQLAQMGDVTAQRQLDITRELGLGSLDIQRLIWLSQNAGGDQNAPPGGAGGTGTDQGGAPAPPSYGESLVPPGTALIPDFHYDPNNVGGTYAGYGGYDPSAPIDYQAGAPADWWKAYWPTAGG